MQSEHINELMAALVKAHSEMTEPAKSEKGYNYQYAPLSEVVKIVRPILAKYELVVTQFPVNDGENIGVETVVAHSSGQYISRAIAMPASNIVQKANKAQEIGAVITYLRRYALMAVCGIAPEDDDAQSVGGSGKDKPVKPRPTFLPRPISGANQRTVATSKATAAQKEKLFSLLADKGKKEADVLKVYKIASVDDLTMDQCADAIVRLQQLNSVQIH